MSPEVLPLSEYISKARQVNSHVAKQAVLVNLLANVFGVPLEDIIPGIEKKIGSRILGVRGRIDLLYSGVVFEVKVDLGRELEDAREKLKKYFQALMERNPQGKYVGIATDLIKFKAFIPIVDNGVVKDVKEISSVNLLETTASEAILWLDSYIFSKSKIEPTASDLRYRFGPAGPTYAIAVETLKELWDMVKDEEDVKLKYELWARNMEIVYGSKPRVEAFIEQTYLVTLVKLVTYLVAGRDDRVTSEKVLKALSGEYFAEYGIVNLVEEDFFTWILNEKIRGRIVELAYSIAKELLRYDLTQVDEDFFKEIYEEIVERGQRHRLGEYYTPEWLAELVFREVLDLWWKEHSEPPKILDPACGSGTFLVNAIHLLKDQLRQAGWPADRILEYIVTSIVGVDINPLATIIARANYLIALGELIHVRRGPLLIPVYVADSIKLPKSHRVLIGNIQVYSYQVNNRALPIPAEVAKNRSRLNRVISAFKDAITSYRSRRNRGEAYKVFERDLKGVVTDGEFKLLKTILDNIISLIDEGKDSIWIYMLSNIYMPVALSESKFDIVVGNPPWIILRYIENKNYQDFVKELFFSYELLDRGQEHLFNVIEIATAFFCRASDLYLRDGGIIGFVMPRSVLTGALQHAEFKKFKSPSMTLLKIFDLEEVEPLFNVPSCVLVAKKGGRSSYPVPAIKLSGKLPRKNVRLAEALPHLSVYSYSYSPPQETLGKSPYYQHFRAGASLYPRTLWFVEFAVHPVLGIDIEKPYCRTSQDPEFLRDVKEPWKQIRLEGTVEKDFVYATLLSKDLVPFGYVELRPVVLPIEPTATGYKLLDVNELRSKGYIHMAGWLEKAQKLWEEKRTERSEKMFLRVIHRLDFQRLLSSQNPGKRYVVLYNTSGKDLASCVIDKQNLPPIRVKNFVIEPRGFVADEKTMFYETDNEMEAYYLCVVLNSDVVNELIKPYQTKGLFGERDIVRRPFLLSIPRFDPNNPTHRRLAELGKICHEKVSRVRFTKKSVAGRREEARATLRKELEEINMLVQQLLGF